MRIGICFGLLSAVWLNLNVATAAGLSTGMQIDLYPVTGDPVTVASIDFTENSGAWEYKMTMASDLFSDHFLSMRPFKCFEGPTYMLCYLPYPYPKTQQIKSGMLTDLEYDLLFIHRQSGEYGINPWNGVYYQLRLNEAAGEINGELREVNLDILAAPPAAGVSYPIRPVDLVDVEPDGHAYPTLLIHKPE